MAVKIQARLNAEMFKRVSTNIIIEAVPGQFDTLMAYVGGLGLPTRQTIRRFNMLSLTAPRQVVDDIATRSTFIKSVYYDADVSAFGLISNFLQNRAAAAFPGLFNTSAQPGWVGTDDSRKLVEADIAEADGITGKGVKVAVLDTGIFQAHPQFSGKNITASRANPTELVDSSGHGTWTASCIVGGQVTTPFGLVAKGVAPDVELNAVKVLETPMGTGRDSDIIKGYEIADQWGAKIISMSLGSDGYAVDNPHEAPIKELTDKGVIVVVAAGNSGPDPSTVGTPGGSTNVLTVGAVDTKTKTIAGFSSRGPVVATGGIKPDVVGPGGSNTVSPKENLVSATAPGSTCDMSDKRPDMYAAIMGTSMATPAVAGTVALAVQYARDKSGGKELTVADIKAFMAKGATKDNDYGWGLIRYSLLK